MSSRTIRMLRVVLVAMLCIVTASADGPRFPRRDVGEAFARASIPDGIDGPRLESELRALRPVPVPVLFAILDRGDVLVPRSGGAPAIVDLDLVSREVVERVLVDTPLSETRRHLEMVASGRSPERVRSLGMWLLGQAGHGRDLELLARLAVPDEADERPSRAEVLAFGSAAERILGRDPYRLWLVLDLFDDVHPALCAPLVKAVERLEHADSLLLLTRLLKRVPAMDPFVLSSIARRGSHEIRPVPEEVQVAVRGCLGGTDPRRELLAIAAVGKIEDFDSVPYLVRLLEDGRDDQRRAASSALGEITGLSLGAEADRWQRWYRAEQTWWEEESLGQIAVLADGHRTVVTKAINEISVRRLHRHELAQELIPCLRRRESEIVVLACRAMGRLGSMTVVSELEECLDAPLRGVREAARESLALIGGPDSVASGSRGSFQEARNRATWGPR